MSLFFSPLENVLFISIHLIIADFQNFRVLIFVLMLTIRFWVRQQYTRRCLCQKPQELCMSSEPPRCLTALDFDQTIIQQDSYLAVSRLLSQGLAREEVPNKGWMIYVKHVLKMLLQQEQVDAKAIGQRVRRLPPVPGMMRLLRQLSNVPGMDLCVMSDSNCFFISEWLDAHGLSNMFHQIYTNPATVLEGGELLVTPYENQTNCDKCPINLCKGGIMRCIIADATYRRIVYVGDGHNDLCPILQLGVEDVACVRRGFVLHSMLPTFRRRLCCRVVTWRDGHELLEHLATLHVLPKY